MQLTKKNVFISGLIGLFVSIALNYLRDFGISYSVYKLIAEPLFFVSSSLLIIASFLFFVRNEVFSSWLTFAKWWIPLTLVLLIISPADGSGAFFPAFFSKELTSIFMSGLFLLISLVIVLYQSLLMRKSEAEETK